MLEEIGSLGKFLVVHLGWIITEEVMHQHTYGILRSQQELHAFDTAVEADVEEGVIDKAELLDGLQIFGIEAGGKYAHEASSFCVYYSMA